MISYQPLFRVLEEKGISKIELQAAIRASSATIAKLAKNEYVSLKTIEQICLYLGCSVEEVVEIKP